MATYISTEEMAPINIAIYEISSGPKWLLRLSVSPSHFSLPDPKTEQGFAMNTLGGLRNAVDWYASFLEEGSLASAPVPDVIRALARDIEPLDEDASATFFGLIEKPDTEIADILTTAITLSNISD